MPDISMCANRKCPDFANCYRAQVKPFESWQSYGDFKQDENGVCEFFISMTLFVLERGDLK